MIQSTNPIFYSNLAAAQVPPYYEKIIKFSISLCQLHLAHVEWTNHIPPCTRTFGTVDSKFGISSRDPTPPNETWHMDTRIAFLYLPKIFQGTKKESNQYLFRIFNGN